MLGRRLMSTHLKSTQRNPFSSFSTSIEEGKRKNLGRKAVSFLLLSLTGGVALSALDDLVIYQSCSSKAMEKASQNQEIIDALGEPIVRGPWYNASVAIAHKRRSVSCTFPMSGPRGTGIFHLRAVRNGDDSWLRPRDWDILIMDAVLHVPANEDKNQTFRINLSDSTAPIVAPPCMECISQKSGSPEKN